MAAAGSLSMTRAEAEIIGLKLIRLLLSDAYNPGFLNEKKFDPDRLLWDAGQVKSIMWLYTVHIWSELAGLTKPSPVEEETLPMRTTNTNIRRSNLTDQSSNTMYNIVCKNGQNVQFAILIDTWPFSTDRRTEKCACNDMLTKSPVQTQNKPTKKSRCILFLWPEHALSVRKVSHCVSGLR